MSVQRPFALLPKSNNTHFLVLVEKLYTTTKCTFKTEYPSNNESKPTLTFKIEYQTRPDKSDETAKKVVNKGKGRPQLANNGKPYTPKEVKLVLNYVDKFGSNQYTFNLLEEELLRNRKSIHTKYLDMIKPENINSKELRKAYRRFSKSEDEFILNYVKEHGEFNHVFAEIKDHMNLRTSQVAKTRLEILRREKSDIIKSGKKKRKPNGNLKTYLWTLEEDKQLLDLVFRDITEITTDEYELLCSLDTIKWLSLEKELPRRNNSEIWRSAENARGRWRRVLLPICKSYICVPGFPESYTSWRDDLIKYIIENELKDPDDVDAHKIEQELCPGQTVGSIKKYVNQINKTRMRSGKEKEPLYITCQRRFSNDGDSINRRPRHKNYFQHDNHIQEVANHYKMISDKWK